jgi:hypothetical protein
MEAEKAAAEVILKRALKKGFHAKVYYEDGAPAGPFTGTLKDLSPHLQATSLETVVFAAPPVRSGDRYAHRGFITFVWGNGPDDVVHDFADNLYIREIVGQPKGDD